MKWSDAVEAMRLGEHVQRASETGRKLLSENDGVPIYECGMEPCFLAAAWSEADQPVRVFLGSMSKTHFIPEAEHLGATDWIVI